MSIYTHQDSNIRKTWFLMAIFFAVVIGTGWFFSYLYNNSAILFFAVIFSVVMNIGAYWYSDKIVLGMYRAKPVTRDGTVGDGADAGSGAAKTVAANPRARELFNIVENLAITAGLPMPKLYIIEEQQPNAFATGRNKEHAALAVTTGLLQILDRSELEGVIAHELAHIGNRDMLVSTVVVVLVGFVTLLSDFFLRSMMFGGHGFGGAGGGGGGGNGGSNRGNAAGVLMLIGIVLAILSPIIALIIQLAISRKREFLADASGALLTRYPEGLASALEKISAAGAASGPMRRANNATAHLFISNPFGIGAHANAHADAHDHSGHDASASRRQPGGLSKLFMTHPPLEERVKALRG